MNHYKLLCDFGELNWIFTDSGDIDTFFHKIVSLVMRHIDSDGCSIFLYNEEADELFLRAFAGMDASSVDEKKCRIGHELANASLNKKHTLFVNNTNDVKKYLKDPNLAKNAFESFLFVPIMRGISKIGVLSLCSKAKNHFNARDIETLNVITSQLANIIENTNIFMKHVHEKQKEKKPTSTIFTDEQKRFKCMVASEGLALGKSRILRKEKSVTKLLDAGFNKKYTENELMDAINETEKQLKKMQAKIEKTLDDAASLIFTSHLLMIKDDVFIGEIKELINDGLNPPIALLTAAKRYIVLFSKSPNEYIREKVTDVEDLVLRIIGNMVREKSEQYEYKERIIIARQLFPSDILKFSTENVAGIIQIRGGVTSHISILSRSLRIPLVIIDMPELFELPANTQILLDANQGEICINPLTAVVNSYMRRNESNKHLKIFDTKIDSKTFTKDGVRVHLHANVNLINDLKLAMKINAEGVGLYRTEFPFLIRDDFPSEEEQFVIYKKIEKEIKNKEIIFRTLDIGGDKIHAYYKDFHERNPFLGMRSIRFSLQNQEIFIQQIRAILRACASRKTKIMFPMISSMDEFVKAKSILMQCREDLIDEGVEFKESLEIGMMIEIPSVVELMEDFAKVSDFFSIGTNDFVQYMLGIDRTNEKVAHLYMPHHPAVLRALKRMVDISKKHNKEIAICGEMAHHQRYVPFLLGIGIRIFSMDAVYLPIIQKQISNLTIESAETVSRRLLEKDSLADLAELFGFY